MEVIMKPTEACNGTCVYCSADGTLQKSPVFPADKLGRLFEIFRGWLTQDDRRNLRFTWHGGEPLLCGREFYRQVVDRQRAVFGPERHRVKNAVQSNLSLVTEGWIPALRELLRGQAIGTSFDIIEGIRGLRSGENLADRWLRAVALLRANHIRVGAVYVVHKESLGRARDLYYYFRNLDPAMNVRFNPLYREGRAGEDRARSLWITADAYGQFLVDLCDVWLADGRRMSVMPLAEWLRAWNGNKRLCCDSRGRCHETHLGIDPDGRVYGCGRVSDNGAHGLGNIFEDDLDDILQRKPRRALASRSARLRQSYCRDCRYWPLCHGGCPMMAWLYHGDLLRETYFCPGRKRLFEHFEQRFGPPAHVRLAWGNARAKRAAIRRRLNRNATTSTHRTGSGTDGPTPPRFVIQVKDCPIPPAPTDALIRTTGLDLARIARGELRPQELRHVFVGERRFMEAPDHCAPFRKNVTVVAEDPSPKKLLAMEDGLRRYAAEYLLTPETIGDGTPAMTAASHRVPVRLAFSDHWPEPVLDTLLDYFLHDPTLEVPIEPFYSLAAAVARKGNGTLWHVFREVLGRHYFVDPDRRVSLSERWAGRGMFFGIIGTADNGFEQSPLWQELQGLKHRLFASQSACSFCKHYPYCGGIWTTAERPDEVCPTWMRVMDRLVEAFEQEAAHGP